MRNEVLKRISEKKIIAIVRGILGEDSVHLAQALCEGGVELMEVTFDPNDAAERDKTAQTIRLLVQEMGEKMCFGAGTVTSVEMVEQARAAGAQFIVSPNTNEQVIRRTVELGMVSIPGAYTPSEIKFAKDCGGDFIKVFPASSLGPVYFKDVHAPLSDCKLLAVGSVNEKNIRDYLAAGAVGAGVASCLFKKEWIRAGEWQRITQATRSFMDVVEG